MAMEQQVKNGSVGSPTMLGLDIFANVDMERLQTWLRTVLLPVLMRPEFFEAMGFPPPFIRRFSKKHAHVLLFKGTFSRRVRSVNDLEILRGLAEALAVRPFADVWDPRDIAMTTAVARQCLDALAALKNGWVPASKSTQEPGPTDDTQVLQLRA
jgi:hypothetical protein